MFYLLNRRLVLLKPLWLPSTSVHSRPGMEGAPYAALRRRPARIRVPVLSPAHCRDRPVYGLGQALRCGGFSVPSPSLPCALRTSFESFIPRRISVPLPRRSARWGNLRCNLCESVHSVNTPWKLRISRSYGEPRPLWVRHSTLRRPPGNVTSLHA